MQPAQLAMSEAANTTSTDNNGDSGLNGKLHVTTFRTGKTASAI